MSVIKSKPPKPNLFPAPKNTKPRTRVRVFKERHTPNPEHHNYNREQNFNQKLSSTLAWLKLQCDGAIGNLWSSKKRITDLFGKDFHKLPREDQLKLREIIDSVALIRAALRQLSDTVGLINREKTKLTKEQMGIPNKK